MVSDAWLDKMPMTTITHLSSEGSYHCPLLMEMQERVETHIKYFKFVYCWVENPTFSNTVEAYWQKPCDGTPMWKFHQKLKRLTSTLSTWSKREFGDIYANVKEYEEKVRVAEENLISNGTDMNRQEFHRVQAEYIRHLKVENAILRQKSQLHWLKYGDANSSYFHAVIRGRRRMFIRTVKTDDGEWIQGDDAIATADCQHFQNYWKNRIYFRRNVKILSLKCFQMLRMRSYRHYLLWMN